MYSERHLAKPAIFKLYPVCHHHHTYFRQDGQFGYGFFETFFDDGSKHQFHPLYEGSRSTVQTHWTLHEAAHESNNLEGQTSTNAQLPLDQQDPHHRSQPQPA